jgi:hypothetical protein
MSKDVLINDAPHLGVSNVKLTTVNGETATFRDVDEVTTPSGKKEITANGTYDISQYESVIVNIPTEGEAVVINSDTTTSFELAHNTEYRRGEVAELTLTLPDSIPDAFDCMVCFTSGTTATTVTIPDGVVLQGDAVSNGVLAPKAEYRYDLIFWYDGVKVWCMVCSVSLSDNAGDEEEPVVPAAYTLTISKGTGVGSVTVTKTSGYGATGTLTSGATVYEGDVLSVSATAATGYTLNSYTETVTVSGNVTVSVTATANSSGGDTPTMDGDGSEANPYLISTAAELVALGAEVDGGDTKSGVYYALANDIDLDGIAWNPIGASYKSEGTDISGSFAGTLDGRGHIISNISVSGMQYAGLFGSNFNGTVMNLGMEGGSISTSYASSTCGAIARKGSGKIINCYSTVPTSAVARSAGIIDEITSGGMVIGCYQAAAVTGTSGKCYAFKAATTTTGDIHYCLWDSELTTDGYTDTTNATNNTGMTKAELQTAADTLNGNLSAVATKAGISVDKLCTWENRINGYPRLVVA